MMTQFIQLIPATLVGLITIWSVSAPAMGQLPLNAMTYTHNTDYEMQVEFDHATTQDWGEVTISGAVTGTSSLDTLGTSTIYPLCAASVRLQVNSASGQSLVDTELALDRGTFEYSLHIEDATSLNVSVQFDETVERFEQEDKTYLAASGSATLLLRCVPRENVIEVPFDGIDNDCDPSTADAFTAVSANFGHSCALDSAGSITCWGKDDFGQVSDAPTTGTFTQISSGYNQNCALEDTGTIICWGSDYWGQVSLTPTAGIFTEVSITNYHSCGLDNTGYITCWGNDLWAQVPEQTQPHRWFEAPTTGLFSQFSAGDTHSCALDSMGAILCWGFNFYDVVTETPGSGEFTQVSAGWHHSCALDSTGAITCWGRTDGDDVPTTGPFTQVSAGWGYSCALEDTGAITCWDVARYALNATMYDPFGVVSDAPTAATFIQVAAGRYHSCALDESGAITCWGSDEYGQVSDTPTAP